MSANGQPEKTPLDIALEMEITDASREPVLKVLHALVSTVMVEELASTKDKTDVQLAAEARVYAALQKKVQTLLPNGYRGQGPLRKPPTQYTTPDRIPAQT